MKFILALLVGSVMGCSSLSNVNEFDDSSLKVSLEASDLIIISSTSWFGTETKELIEQDNRVETSGIYLLKQVVKGYSNQVGDVEVLNSVSESEVSFKIKEIKVRQSFISLNFPKPGPIYKIIMKADIVEQGRVTDSVTLKTKANMAELNFEHLSFKWMNESEKSNSEYQLITFDEGLRKLYQKLFFNYFDISLRV